ncbi:hypothetical protein HN748_00205 [Candidatus Peregrinibacteria bacterium]|jgi:hypothetical protein|nr:hypothetical protein [Candidatus Peregrinibacteria bacterium]MBT7483595.1 hypothetical protein [Candidatus Peregrinibacteria bacterium]MBT7702634.1 hypothetical protein [Candidatus Peregrinibacteria bacterium]
MFSLKKRLIAAFISVITLVSFTNFTNTVYASSLTTIVEIVISDGFLGTISIKALPEKRVSVLGGNLGTLMRVRFTDPDTDDQLLETSYTSSSFGLTTSNVDISTLTPNEYHIFAKGRSHLTRKMSNVNLTTDTTNIDFSYGDTEYLYAGDVNGTIFGDDIVNAIDLSILINDLDSFDLRTDLNRDNTVNALDLSILITNLDKEGDA